MVNKDILLLSFNEEEILVILSNIGFNYADWPLLKKIGVKNFWYSDVLLNILNEKSKQIKQLDYKIKSMRNFLDNFYANDGYIISPLSYPNINFFKYKYSSLGFLGQLNKHLLKEKPIVAIVGSRKASSEIIAKTLTLAQTLAKEGILIVSGGAFGVDTAAHEGALAAGSTIKILGTALYRGHKVNNSAKLSLIFPYGPLMAQRKFMFVERNRYVVLLADALVIMAGQKGSGTLHSARFAKEYNIPIYVYEGDKKDPSSYVANYLLQEQRAKPISNFNNLASEMGLLSSRKELAPSDNNNDITHTNDLPLILRLLYEHRSGLSLDEIIALTGMSLLELQKDLLAFELAGNIVRDGAQFVIRIDR